MALPLLQMPLWSLLPLEATMLPLRQLPRLLRLDILPLPQGTSMLPYPLATLLLLLPLPLGLSLFPGRIPGPGQCLQSRPSLSHKVMVLRLLLQGTSSPTLLHPPLRPIPMAMPQPTLELLR